MIFENFLTIPIISQSRSLIGKLYLKQSIKKLRKVQGSSKIPTVSSLEWTWLQL